MFNEHEIRIEQLELALQLIAGYSTEPFAVEMARTALGIGAHDDCTHDWIEIQATVDAAGTYAGEH